VSSKPVLVIEHESQCPPGWMGEWLQAAGADLDVRRPHAGDAVPADLSWHSGLLVLGGEMGAYDDALHPWLTDVKQLIVSSATGTEPVLGICLGLQLAAVALGGEVAPNPAGQQIGVLDVGWAEAAYDDPLLAVTARRPHTPAVQWNNDVVTRLPDGATLLASTPRGELQAARLAPSLWGVQWHPEAGDEIIRPWAEHDRDAAAERGVDLDRYVRDVVEARDALRESWQPLATAFVGLCHVAGTRRTVGA
jgi:GMP synthase (glutamine-hydrolysing)